MSNAPTRLGPDSIGCVASSRPSCGVPRVRLGRTLRRSLPLEPGPAPRYGALDTRHLGHAGRAFGLYREAIISWQSQVWNEVLGVTGTSPTMGLTSADWNDMFMAPFPSNGGLSGEVPESPDESSVLIDHVGSAALGMGVAKGGEKLVQLMTQGASAGRP